ncbi:MAG: hypothetical protein JWO89_917 [Verrucomicrobiaceae bacterium]|nr:hypothetical protein [Verrucomicrobiaceae bacterium]
MDSSKWNCWRFQTKTLGSSMSTAASIADAALRLPYSDRAQIALVIMDSLPPDAWTGNALLIEAEQRDEEMDRGQVKELTHEEFIAGLRR